MMTISVRYFASLRERLGRGGEEIDAQGVQTVADVWRRATQEDPPPANLLMAVNQEYAKGDSVVAEGDEVGFFPPVTGG